MKTRILAGIALVVTALIALGPFGATVASAQTTRPTPATPAAGQPVRLEGKVSRVGTSSLLLTTRRGDVTVNVTAGTFIVVKKDGRPAEGTIADLAVDKVATVVGVATSDARVVDARLISQGVADARRFLANHPRARQAVEHMAAGTITAINGNTITLQGMRVPDVTIQTTANTVVLNNCFTTVGTLKVGDKIAVLGKPNRAANAQNLPQSRTITAWGIRVENGTTQLSMAHVDAVNGSTLTIKSPRNRTGASIVLDSGTAYKSLSISPTDRSATLNNAAQSDIKAGSNLIVEGTLSSDGKTITAKSVIILPARNQ